MKRVLFVGAFRKRSASGHVGGQTFACRSLIASPLNQSCDFVLIDTTASTNKERSRISRSVPALKRLTAFMWHVLFGRIDSVLIFTSAALGFTEKGFMARVAKRFGKHVVIAPRSGHLIKELRESQKRRRFAERVFGASDAVICQGNFWHTFFHEELGVDDEKLFVIRNWIPEVAPGPAKEAWSESDSARPMQVLFMGWVERSKGIFELLEAMKQISFLNINLRIAGGGKDSEEVQEIVEALELEPPANVEFCGWVHGDEKQRLLQEADVLVLPSHAEGSPNIVLEAIRAGCTVIATKVGAVPDTIHHEKTGLLVEPGDIAGLAANLDYCATDVPRARAMADAAGVILADQHTLEGAVDQMSRIFGLHEGT